MHRCNLQVLVHFLLKKTTWNSSIRLVVLTRVLSLWDVDRWNNCWIMTEGWWWRPDRILFQWLRTWCFLWSIDNSLNSQSVSQSIPLIVWYFLSWELRLNWTSLYHIVAAVFQCTLFKKEWYRLRCIQYKSLTVMLRFLDFSLRTIFQALRSILQSLTDQIHRKSDRLHKQRLSLLLFYV
jgi:hypothetical protein